MIDIDVAFGVSMLLLFGGAGFHLWKLNQDMHNSSVHAWKCLAPSLPTEDLCRQLAQSTLRAHDRTESTIIAIIVDELDSRGVTYKSKRM